MNYNALGVANELIDLADNDGVELTLLKLVKLTYLSYAFGLVLAPREPMIDPRFDKVEAWRYGPVIPSVYHSFKHRRDEPIRREDMAVAMVGEDGGRCEFATPRIEGDRALRTIKFVWKRYRGVSAGQLVDILHLDGTPWRQSYIPGVNAEIPEEVTRRFYTLFVDLLLKSIEERTPATTPA